MKTNKENQTIKILYIVPASISWGFFVGNLAYQQRYGFQVGICSSPGKELDQIIITDKLDVSFEVNMARAISPFNDVISLWKLFWVMKKYKPTVVIAGIPKANFLGMLVSFFARIPIRISQRHGLGIETATGLKRILLFITEWISSFLATEVWHVSNSLMSKCIQLRIANPKKSKVILNGSANGIDFRKFSYNSERIYKALNIAHQLKINPENTVIGYVGRLSNEKGIIELRWAFEKILQQFPESKLLLVGNKDLLYPLHEDVLSFLGSHPNVILTGHIDDITPYLCLIDIFVLPSYREGLGNVVLEASAMGLPTVGTNVTGVISAVIEDETGKIVPLKNVEKLTEAIVEYIKNPSLRLEHGINGSRRIVRDFVPENIWRAYNIEIKKLLLKKSLISEDFCNNIGESVSIDLDKHEQNLRQWLAVKQHLLHERPIDDVCQEFHVERESVEKLVQKVMEDSNQCQE
jgi:glycosyltransferase involved in cell wall biosynthesis